ncbi:MAG: GH92 family glycosyl hydrolase, partial [Clostridia bacterium]|nr:GH92 family glycosyl hydrolase [Clostridia bacterium]
MRYLPFVNVKQGGASVHRFSNGNTLPLTGLPFAMADFAPQTDSSSSWFFHSDDRCIEGVRLTHQPSPWIADYGSLVFLPQKFKPEFKADTRWSGYRPEDAELMPHYMKLKLLRSRCCFELAPVERGAVMRVRFEKEGENWFSVLPLKGSFTFERRECSDFIFVTVDNRCDDNAVNFRMYAVIKFGEGQTDGRYEYCENEGLHVGVSGKELDVFVSTSYIGFEQAEITFVREFGSMDFDAVKNEAESIWEKYLSKVEIEAFSEKQLRTFYSCMYRAFLYPHKCYEIDGNGSPVHYCPCDGTVRKGVRYTDNGFWDTYRTVYPFFSLVAVDEYKEMCEGFVNDYLECGWLPRWPSIGERGCMPSTLLDAVLCDAAVKGILKGKTLENAFEGMLKHANVNSENDDYGRSGAESYVKFGYVPIEAHKESVNLTLDAAYGDWCIARIAEILGRDDIVPEYDRRAKNYANLFDKKTGFMRARFENGAFRPDFSPTAWGRDYTEGSA